MKDFDSLHQKVQEHINCFAETDPLQEMAGIKSDPDASEAALKWLALVTLHGINSNAKKITIEKDDAGDVVVTAKYRKSQLPSPGSEIGRQVFDTIRGITHIEGKKGKMPVALGVRDSSIDVQIKVKSNDAGEKVTIKFPE